MKDITHIARPSLPWRVENKTECGLPADRHPTWSRDAAIVTAREMGKQRFAMMVCMTCMNTAERHATWEQDPLSCMDRYVAPVWGQKSDAQAQMEAELRAIAMLVDAHREEFDDAVASLLGATDLSERRAMKSYRRAGFGQ